MSQSRKTDRSSGASNNALPGIISAAVVLIVLGLVAGLLISRAGSDTAVVPADEPADTLTQPTTAPPVAEPAAVAGILPTATTYQYPSAPPLTIDPASEYTATILTPRGEIVVELLPEIAPQTVNNFAFLANNNFYNGLTWHRVLPGFMAQGGDPTGTGAGDPGYSIPAEFTSELTFDEPGLLAMARSGDPDSAGSQFFITTGPAPWLNEQYTIFGRVISGQDIVNNIPLRDPNNPNDLATPGETILGVTVNGP
ncbi:MAG: peptidylprolyl isomerase [Oscillochloris sp.]|nr:peptidylprolyl isomerase [Oscillochloris sp.]